MPIGKIHLILILGILVFWNSNLVAQKTGPDYDFLIRDNFRYDKSVHTITGTESALSKTVHFQYSPDYSAHSGIPADIAIAYLKQNALLFGLIQPQNDLRITSDITSPAGTHVSLIQIRNGLPIYGTQTVVTIDRMNRVAFVASQLRPDIGQPRNYLRITTTQAISAAKNYLSITGKELTPPQADPFIFPSRSEGDKIVYRVWISNTSPRGDWEIMVDAETSEILNVSNKLMYQQGGDGRGLVWIPDPLRSAGVFYGGDFSDPGGSDEDTDSLNAQRTSVDLLNISFENNFYILKGPYVRLSDLESPPDTFARAADADSFNYHRSQQEFEHVMVYYHIDRSYRYLSSLGFDVPGLYEFDADPHGMEGEDNSYYSPFGNFCVFGEGGVDDAEDAAVIWHEYAHAIQENIAHMSYLGETASLQEGSSDYWAASFARGLSEFAWGQVFLWDAGIHSENDSTGEFWAGRRCDLNLIYPQDYIDAPDYQYQNGQIWSSALMSIWAELGKEITDRLFVQSHYLWGNSPDLRSAARAFVKSDSLLYSGIHVPVILNCFENYGLIQRSDYFPQIIHQPLRNTEDRTGPFQILAQIIPARAELDSSSMWVYWGNTSGTFSDSLRLESDGIMQSFSAEIPGSSTDTTYYYYLEVADKNGNLSRDPQQAPQVVHKFRAGIDNIPPLIEHAPLTDQALSRWPSTIDARVEDNLGVDQVWVKYYINNEVLPDSFQLYRNQSEIWYSGTFNTLPGLLSIGDSVKYSIFAIDSSSQRNITVFPVSGFFKFNIIIGGGEIAFNLELDDGGFHATGDWQWGQAKSGPYSAHSGTQMWGTNLDGDYTNGQETDSLWIPEIDLSSFRYVTLAFWHWYNFEDNYDGGNVKVSVDQGKTWEIVSPVLGYDTEIMSGIQNPMAGESVFNGFSGGWIYEQVNLDRFIGEKVLIGFFLGTDASTSYDGWYIDDISIADNYVTINAPSQLQVVDDRGIVRLIWDDMSRNKSFPDTIQTKNKGLAKNQDLSNTEMQMQFLYYKIYKRKGGGQFLYVFSTPLTEYTDSLVVAGGTYQYFVTANLDSIESPGSDTVTVTVQAVVSIKTDESLPHDFNLWQNYPNPFNPVTFIRFQLPEPSLVRLEIFDLYGSLVCRIVNETRNAGTYTENWDGRNLHGMEVGSGIYFYRLQTDSWTRTRKMILLR